MKNWLMVILGLILVAGCYASQKPNIVLIFVDDLAWNGWPVRMDDEMANSAMPVVEMPHLEKLATEGMKFRNAYAGAPQCAPSRVSLQTGQSAARTGFTVYMNAFGQEYYNVRENRVFPVIDCVSDETIKPGAVTIPKALKPLGYVSAHFGKWHMRGDPGEHGYISHDGNTDNNPGNTIGSGPDRTLEGIEDPKLMFGITKRSLDFMSKQVQSKNPFYLQISHYAMHEGSECWPETRRKYLNHPAVRAFYEKNGWDKNPGRIRVKEDPAVWLGMADDLDTCIGAVLKKINELGIADNTYVVVTSDNGYRHKFYPGLPQPLHGAKWWVWEGGIRVPMIVRGPAIPADSVFLANVVNYDFMPTFVDWAGGDPAKLKDIDGVSLAGYMRGEEPDEAFKKRYLYFHYPHYRTSMPHSAIISGHYKVLHFYERPDIAMLFDLAQDLGEVRNISSVRPDEHRTLHGEMMRYFKEAGARIPKLNPNYDPDAYKEAREYKARMIWGPFEGQRPLAEDEK